ncbi:M15 family metallopeptidase [Aeromicrobium sp. UC242_57]|uniref:M15 family metallopeptidase n=1 Tax=Aeromicrobium sp. UC242_57 TaxID=3374624 RepID=UPI00379094DD
MDRAHAPTPRSARSPTESGRACRGRSWRKGCPVGRQSLRIVRVSYWAFDGYVRRGEIVVNKSVASSTAKLFTDLFAAKAPIRSMYRVDRFGYSKTLRGADDLRSMRADNTSGFNCRRVVGWTSRMSPHAVGRSIDINPWENPFASRTGYQPNKSWARRTKPAAITYRGTNDPVVKIFRKHGFRWLGKSDLQHFQR